MRKRIAPAISVRTASPVAAWLDVEGLAEVHVTSEDPHHPIESALLPGTGAGWRASEPGRQTIRLLFDNPQDVQRIHLVFVEEHFSRTQEFVLRWSRDLAATPTEILRQQYHFTPVASEVEDYHVDLRALKLLELEITPALEGEGPASLTELRLQAL